MKKLLITTTLLLFGLCLKAQQELFENTWYLEQLINESHSGPIFPPESDEFDPITLNFITDGETTSFHTGVCADIDANITSLTENQIYFDDFVCCGENVCPNPDNTSFENEYVSFFMGMEVLYYNITENSDGSLSLFLGNSIFSETHFTNQSLSISDISGSGEANFQLAFQNGNLIIQSSKSAAESVSIYDLTEKLVLTSKVSPLQKTNASGLPNGIYIVKILDRDGTVYTKKIRKE